MKTERFKLSTAYVIRGKPCVSHRKSLIISEAVWHLLRTPFTDAKKLRIIILVSTYFAKYQNIVLVSKIFISIKIFTAYLIYA